MVTTADGTWYTAREAVFDEAWWEDPAFVDALALWIAVRADRCWTPGRDPFVSRGPEAMPEARVRSAAQRRDEAYAAAGLTPQQAAAAALVDDGCSWREAAVLMRLSLQAFRTHLNRARVKLAAISA